MAVTVLIDEQLLADLQALTGREAKDALDIVLREHIERCKEARRIESKPPAELSDERQARSEPAQE